MDGSGHGAHGENENAQLAMSLIDGGWSTSPRRRRGGLCPKYHIRCHSCTYTMVPLRLASVSISVLCTLGFVLCHQRTGEGVSSSVRSPFTINCGGASIVVLYAGTAREGTCFQRPG